MTAASSTPAAEQPARSQTIRQPSLPDILAQHAEQAGFLFEQRSAMTTAANIGLKELAWHDEQLDAHLDGLRLAGPDTWNIIQTTLDPGTPGGLFVATVLTLETRDTPRLKQLLAYGEANTAAQPGLLWAFEWAALTFTQPLLAPLLTSRSPFYRRIGLHLLGRHALQGDTEWERALSDPDAALQIQALQAIAESGTTALLPHCLALAQSGQGEICFWAARAAALLGEKDQSVAHLVPWAQTPNRLQSQATTLLANIIPIAEAQPFLTHLARQGLDRRLLVQLAGELGDPASLPALLRLLPDAALGRLAGQAFSMITGVNLVEENLDRPAPETVSTGPTDSAEDNDVASDPDESLPWPDGENINRYWSQRKDKPGPGIRHLQGKPVTPATCYATLRTGFQPQRATAALQLKLLQPAQPMFCIDAPVWRQQRTLSATV